MVRSERATRCPLHDVMCLIEGGSRAEPRDPISVSTPSPRRLPVTTMTADVTGNGCVNVNPERVPRAPPHPCAMAPPPTAQVSDPGRRSAHLSEFRSIIDVAPQYPGDAVVGVDAAGRSSSRESEAIRQKCGRSDGAQTSGSASSRSSGVVSSALRVNCSECSQSPSSSGDTKV